MSEPFPHPETGAPLVEQEDFQVALLDLEERMAPLYRARGALRREAAARFQIEMPHKRNRTLTQDLVARCPRCGGQIKEEAA